MKAYRIFSRDRGHKYSALTESRGDNASQAIRNAKGCADLKRIPDMLKAIEWPPNARGEKWLEANT